MPLSGSSSPTIVLNSVVLPTPLGPMTPTMPLRGRVNDRSLISSPALEALVEVLDLDDDAAQPRPGRDLDLLEVELAGLLGLGGHLLVAPRRALLLACRALAPDRTQASSSCSRFCSLASLRPCTASALGLLLQVGRVVALVRVGAAAVELEDPLGDVVQEVPVVGDGQDRALVARRGAVRATARSRRRGGWSARRAAAGRAWTAAACTARRGGAHHRTGG